MATMVGAIPSSADRAFSTACSSSTIPVDSGSGFRSLGTSGQADGGSASAEVMALSNGRFTGTGAMVGGQPINLGSAAWLRVGGIDLVIGSVRQQAHCTAIASHLGIDVNAYRVILLKSSVHFRADWQPYADSIVVGASPGSAPLI